MDRLFVILLCAALMVVGQNGKKSQNEEKGLAKEPETVSWLSRYDLRDAHPKQFHLPKRLSEASGLAISDDGRLFSHDDELGIIYQVDYTTGGIVKQFSLGAITLRGDFEGIAMKGELMYLVSSNGNIYGFKEGNDGEKVSYKIYRTFLTARNNVEGLEYDNETDCLLLACKGEAGKGYEDYKAVYAFSLKKMKLEKRPRLLIPLNTVSEKSHGGQFNPSGIAKHPKSGTYFIISANGHSIIEMSSDGAVLDQEEIPNRLDKQPEGITFAPDLTMIICDDGKGGKGTLTLYPLRR